MSEPTTTQPAAPAPGCSKGCLIALGVFAAPIAVILGILLFAPKSDSNSYPAEALLNCRDYVKAALKSPSSATFHDESASGSGTTWTVTGDVDADNSFGASIRNSYSCTVAVSGGAWSLVSLSGLSN